MPNKFKILLLFLCAAGLLGVFFYFKQSAAPAVCFENKCFEVELAKKPAERERGLMFRSGLDKNRGMLFIFPEAGIYPFWMKNTLISLDIIWINSQDKVVFIEKNAQPCFDANVCPSINPGKKADYVLEINAGSADGLEVGDKVDIKL